MVTFLDSVLDMVFFTRKKSIIWTRILQGTEKKLKDAVYATEQAAISPGICDVLEPV